MLSQRQCDFGLAERMLTVLDAPPKTLHRRGVRFLERQVTELAQLRVRALQLFLVVRRPDPEAGDPLFPPAHPRLGVERGLPLKPGAELELVDVAGEPGGQGPSGSGISMGMCDSSTAGVVSSA